jgi:hypothetical protein
MMKRCGTLFGERVRMETKIWNVPLRSKKDSIPVEAATVKEEDDGKLTFRDASGNVVGWYWLAEVQGYSVEPSSGIAIF